MFVRVQTKHGEQNYPEHVSWIVGTEGELDLLHFTGVTTTTIAAEEWLLVSRVLEEGESFSPPVDSNPNADREARDEGDETGDESEDEEDENFWPPFR